MREHLFKAKGIDDYGWVYGNLVKSATAKAYIVTHMDDSGTFSPARPRLLFVEVDPETVCEYTGLTDKNGVKIFEGDCIGHKGNVVEYLSGIFCINGDTPVICMTRHEVLGNIHDTKAVSTD